MKGKVIELRKEVQEVIEARNSGKKILYAFNIDVGHLGFSEIQIICDYINSSGNSIFFFKENQLSVSVDKRIFKIRFSHSHEYDGNFVLHYSIFL